MNAVLRLVGLFFALSLAAARAQRTDEDPPPYIPKSEGEVTELMKATGIKRIVIPATAKRWRDLEGEVEAWFDRVALPPVLKKLAEQPYGERAIAFVKQARVVLSSDEYPVDVLEKVRSDGARQFWSAKIYDPFIDHFMAELGARTGHRSAFETAAKVSKKLRESAAGPDLAAFDLAVQREVGAMGGGSMELSATWQPWVMKRFEEALAQKAFEGRPRAALAYYTYMINQVPENAEDLMALTKTSGLPEWMTETLLGVAEQTLAWRARGGDVASTVTPQGWEGFRLHLERASKHLTKAWELNPAEPYAASHMISNGMGQSAKIDVLQLWHGRSVAACADYPDPYGRLKNALAPKWLGSEAHQLAFAFACADTELYGTGVPVRFETEVAEMARNLEDRSAIYRNPVVADRLARLSLGAWKAASPVATQAARAKAAVIGWMTGRFDVASGALAGLQGKVPFGAEKWLEEFETSPTAFIGESVLCGGPLRPVYEFARAAQQNGHHRAARMLYGALLFLAPPAVIPHLGETLQVINAEEMAANGRWTQIVGEGRPWGWISSEGECGISSRGVLHLFGTRERFRMYFTGRLAPDFAMRGTAVFNPKKVEGARPSAFGIVFDRNRLGAGRGARSAFTVEIKPTSVGAGKAALIYAGKELSAPVDVELRAENDFEFTREGRRVVLRWNGKEAVAEMPANHVPPPDAAVGVGWANQGINAVTEVTKLEVRNLKVEL